MSRPGTLPMVALVVVLAGCGAVPAGSGPSDPADTATPVPVPETDATGSSGASGVPLPSGVSEDGSVNATELTCAHQRRLSNRSYTVDWASDYRPSAAMNATGSNGSQVARVDGERISLSLSPGDGEAGNASYVDATGVYVRQVVNDTVVTRRSDDGSLRGLSAFPASFLGFERELSPADVNVTLVDRDGRPRYRIRIPERPPFDRSEGNYSATLRVTPRGVIESLFVDQQLVLGESEDGSERSIRYRTRITVRDVGETTVTEPDWVTALKRNRTATAGTATPSPSPCGD